MVVAVVVVVVGLVVVVVVVVVTAAAAWRPGNRAIWRWRRPLTILRSGT